MRDEDYLNLTREQIIARWSPFCRHTALSEKHKAAEKAKADKEAEKAAKKAAKEEAARLKAAEKAKLAAMTPEEAKAYRKARKQQKLMDAAGEPRLL